MARYEANQIVVRDENGKLSMSIYSGDEPATMQDLAESAVKLQAAFPNLQNSVIKTIINRAIEKGFSRRQFEDAVNRTIDTCEYQNFAPAKVLNYDIRCKLYSYNEACEIMYLAQNPKEVVPIVINGQRFWVYPADKIKYNIPDEM